jgi:hypothetical protein
MAPQRRRKTDESSLLKAKKSLAEDAPALSGPLATTPRVSGARGLLVLKDLIFFSSA